MHGVDSVIIAQVIFAPLRQELFTHENNQILKICVLSQFPILSGVHDARFNLVGQWSNH
jgi:hypothetical protein